MASSNNPDQQIFFFCFGREDSEILAQSNNGNLKEQSQKASQVKKQLVQLDLQFEEQQKMTTSKSFWYCKYDKNNIFYQLEVGQKYPERCAYQFIKEVQNHLETLNNLKEADDVEIKFHCKRSVQELVKKYSDLASIDKISEATANLEDVRIQMNENIGKMVENMEQVDKLQSKTEDIKKNSTAMKKQAKDLERIMYRRNMKLKIIITIVLLTLALFIIVPLVGDGVKKIKGK